MIQYNIVCLFQERSHLKIYLEKKIIPCFCKENVIRERYHLIEVTFCDYWILFLPCFALSLISLVRHRWAQIWLDTYISTKQPLFSKMPPTFQGFLECQEVWAWHSSFPVFYAAFSRIWWVEREALSLGTLHKKVTSFMPLSSPYTKLFNYDVRRSPAKPRVLWNILFA